MSAESYAEQQFKAAAADRDSAFVERLDNFVLARHAGRVVVVDSSTPVGEALARIKPGDVLAVHDEDAADGFTLTRITEVG